MNIILEKDEYSDYDLYTVRDELSKVFITAPQYWSKKEDKREAHQIFLQYENWFFVPCDKALLFFEMLAVWYAVAEDRTHKCGHRAA